MDGSFLRMYSKGSKDLENAAMGPLKRQTSGDGRTAEIEYTPDWRGAIQDKLVDFGCDERFACVTDQLGVEIRIWDENAPEPWPDRFPLHIRCHEPVVSQKSFGGPPTPTTSSDFFDSQKNGGSGVFPGHVCIPVNHTDMWPGILDLTLSNERAADGFLVITDKTGVELMSDAYMKRIPPPEQFPLKLHFRSKYIGPQNMAPRDSHTGRSGHQIFAARSTSSGQQVDHTFELRYADILPVVIQNKFNKEFGVHLDRAQRNQILITDCVGVIINPRDGVPDPDRCPLKLHIEGAALATAEPVPLVRARRQLSMTWWK